MIPSKKLTKEETKNLQDIMSCGNLALGRLVKLTGILHKKLRADLVRSGFNPLAFKDRITGVAFDLLVLTMPDMRRVWECESDILAGFSGQAMNQANIVSRRTTLDEVSDLEQEAVVALLNAMYHYTDTSVCFLTYCTYSIYRHLNRHVNRQKPMGAITNDDLELLARHRQLCNEANDHLTWDQIVDRLGLDKKARQRLLAAQRSTPLLASEIMSPEDRLESGTEDRNDYSSLGKVIGVEDEDEEDGDKPSPNLVPEAIRHARLSEREQLVIEAFLASEDTHGWQTLLAKDLKTCRANISFHYRNALSKIKNAYLRLNNQYKLAV